MSLVISGATIIDGVSEKPIEGQSIWIEGARIKAIGRRDELGVPPGAKVIDARGKYVIPGLMNANVHLFGAITLERLARHMDHYEEVIAEAAQVALKAGLTTVFDTYGPRRPLMNVRDQINAGKIPGSRFFCAGNIIGFDGLFSPDFFSKATEVASAAFANRINAIHVENVGRHLMWLTPEQVAKEVRAYIAKGTDFLKYASNDHGYNPGCFLQFSPRVQQAIVEEAHRAGITAQAHTHTVEGLHIAIEAGCDLITHCNFTGPVPIPEETLELFVKRGTGAVVFPFRQNGLDWVMQNMPSMAAIFQVSDTNARNLIRSGAMLLLANDEMVLPPEMMNDPKYAKTALGMPKEEFYGSLTSGHFFSLRAMEEKGCPPMQMLQAVTKNIAVAYKKDKDLGTLEKGKIADMLILDKDPLASAENYRSIHTIIKDGAIVDRNALPLKPILTAPMDPLAEEEAVYIPSIISSPRLPMCPMCMRL